MGLTHRPRSTFESWRGGEGVGFGMGHGIVREGERGLGETTLFRDRSRNLQKEFAQFVK